MTSVVLLNILPISCIIFFLINTIASTIWQNFVRIFNKSEGVFDAYVPLSKSIFNYLLIAAMLFIVFLFNSGAFIVNFQKMQIAAILFSLLAFTQTSRTSALTLDHMIFCTFVVFASLFLILSKDLISVFFTLELLNMLIIYSFFFNATGVRLNAVNSSIKICASCIYQFILNFFSSIILYSAINWYIGLTGGASFSNAYLLSEESALKAPLSVLLGAFLLKFGSGP